MLTDVDRQVGGGVPRSAGDRMAASYANYYMAGSPGGGRRGVIVPGFGVEADKRAAEVLRAVFPDREVVVAPLCREVRIVQYCIQTVSTATVQCGRCSLSDRKEGQSRP